LRLDVEIDSVGNTCIMADSQQEQARFHSAEHRDPIRSRDGFPVGDFQSQSFYRTTAILHSYPELWTGLDGGIEDGATGTSAGYHEHRR
jgi:hypothetical protein